MALSINVEDKPKNSTPQKVNFPTNYEEISDVIPPTFPENIPISTKTYLEELTTKKPGDDEFPKIPELLVSQPINSFIHVLINFANVACSKNFTDKTHCTLIALFLEQPHDHIHFLYFIACYLKLFMKSNVDPIINDLHVCRFYIKILEYIFFNFPEPDLIQFYTHFFYALTYKSKDSISHLTELLQFFLYCCKALTIPANFFDFFIKCISIYHNSQYLL